MKNLLTAAALALALGPLVAAPACADDDATDDAPSLYERLGGLRGIAPLVEDFVNNLIYHPSVGQDSAPSASRNTPSSYLTFQFTQLICEMSGGPCVYSGKTMKEAHQGLRVSAEEWEAMNGELKKSLQKFSVPAAEQQELIELLGETRDDIVGGAEVTTGKAD